MGPSHLRIVVITLIAAATAACGAGPAGPTPNAVTGAVPSPARTSPAPSGQATATLKLGAFGNVDGPGQSVTEALANAGVGPLLVNGILLKEADDTVWLCEVLLRSSPPQCAEPKLLVENWLTEDQTLVNGEGIHVADGVRWVERAQLVGVVSSTGSR
jgi:hypothetical protein